MEKDLLNEINLALKKSSLTQYEIAKMIGVSAGMMSQIKSGKSKPKPEKLSKLLNILDIKINQNESDMNYVNESSFDYSKNKSPAGSRDDWIQRIYYDKLFDRFQKNDEFYQQLVNNLMNNFTKKK